MNIRCADFNTVLKNMSFKRHSGHCIVWIEIPISSDKDMSIPDSPEKFRTVGNPMPQAGLELASLEIVA